MAERMALIAGETRREIRCCRRERPAMAPAVAPQGHRWSLAQFTETNRFSARKDTDLNFGSIALTLPPAL